MAHYAIGCDIINGQEESYKQYLMDKVTEKGHTAEILPTGPNGVQQFGLDAESSGKIGVQIVGGLCGFTAADMATGVEQGYYHYDSMVILGTSEFSGYTETLSTDAMTSYAMQIPHDAYSSSLDDMYVGKTPAEFNSDYGEYCRICLGDTFDNAIDMLLGGNAEEPNTKNTTTFKDMIKDVLSGWSGQIVCYTINDQMYVHKIPLPSDDFKKIQEGVDIVDGSLSFTDINPDTINTLRITYNGGNFTLKDENLINRFGEHVKELNIPAESYDEAVDMAVVEFYKLKADDGRKVELNVIGQTDLKSGDWIQLYLPAFKELCYMFVTSVSTSLNPSSEYITKIELVDAPPILSEPEEVFQLQGVEV